MKSFLASIAVMTTAISATAAPLWMRDIAIAPDGSAIAFTYKGDIYKVNPAGGDAVRLTTESSYESRPVWSPDSKSIAFATDRNGGQDVYIMKADGSAPQRLTFNSVAEMPEAFTPDGKYVLFSAAIQDPASSAMFPSARLTELYKVPVTGGRITQQLAVPAHHLSYLPDGKSYLYMDRKGMENEWRKHAVSSDTRDIWKYDAATGKHINLTSRYGEDRDPVVSPDGKTAYILSERDGKSFNVYSFPVDNPSAVKQISDFRTHPVRFLSQSRDGLLAYGYNGEIYTQKPGEKARKVNVQLIDNDINDKYPVRISSTSGAEPSPDGKMVAFTNRGDVFVTSVEYPTTRQITATPAAEGGITWGADNRTLAYHSMRDGHFNIYTATIGRKEDPNFPNATVIEEKALFNPKDGIERTYPSFSPDGKQLAFIENRRALKVMDMDSKKVRTITDGSTKAESNGGFDYSWSPDGKWIVMELTNNGHQPYSDVAIVNTTGKPVVTNITRSSYFDAQPHWVMDGNAILFISDRYGLRSQASWGSENDAMLVFMNQDSYDKFRLSKEDYELRKELERQQKADKAKADGKDKADKKDKKDSKKAKADSTKKEEPAKELVELKGIEDRIVRLTPSSSEMGDAIITPDGETLYYTAKGENGNDLWRLDLRKRDLSRSASLDGNYYFARDKKGDNIFLLGGSGLRKMTPAAGKPSPITYSGRMDIDPAAERDFMFDYVKQETANRIFRKDMQGVNWEAMTENYRRFLPYINNNYDYAILLSELLGELNVSHSGGRYSSTGSNYATANLGLLYDWEYTGPGLKIAEVIENGPFDHANTNVTKGTIVEKINGESIGDTADYTTMFSSLAGKKTLVSLYNPATGKRWEEVVLPINAGSLNNLLYNRWVKSREAAVDSLSGGRLGYVHIKSMDDNSYRNIYSKLFGKFNDKEGIVIDTRWNGGGRLHEDIEVLFSGHKYLTQEIRGVDVCVMPSRRWTKPSIMIQCEANYSNAHGTPWVYKTMGLGKLVGAAVPGTMSSVNWITLQDPSLVFGVPVVGFRTAEGNYLENTQLEPDIHVLNDPATVVKGDDRQLKAAVDELLKQLPRKK